jgi:Mycobacterium membrane protein
MGVVRIISRLARSWIPLVVVITTAISAFAIYRMHGVFGSYQSTGATAGAADRIVSFNPKRVLYEVYGPSGTVGSISYLDEHAAPQRAHFSSLPWSFEVSTTLPSMFANLVVQGDSDTIGCRITVNGDLRDDQSSNGHDAQAFCLVKAA